MILFTVLRNQEQEIPANVTNGDKPSAHFACSRLHSELFRVLLHVYNKSEPDTYEMQTKVSVVEKYNNISLHFLQAGNIPKRLHFGVYTPDRAPMKHFLVLSTPPTIQLESLKHPGIFVFLNKVSFYNLSRLCKARFCPSLVYYFKSLHTKSWFCFWFSFRRRLQIFQQSASSLYLMLSPDCCKHWLSYTMWSHKLRLTFPHLNQSYLKLGDQNFQNSEPHFVHFRKADSIQKLVLYAWHHYESQF